MESTSIKRSVVFVGHKTSVSLEDEFWKGLKEISALRKITWSGSLSPSIAHVTMIICRLPYVFSSSNFIRTKPRGVVASGLRRSHQAAHAAWSKHQRIFAKLGYPL
jgi:hypothetical protein